MRSGRTCAKRQRAWTKSQCRISKNEDADDQISDGNNQTEEAEEVREPEVREPDLNTSEDDSEDTDAVQQDKSEKVKTQTETENMDELAGVYRDVIPDGEYVIGEKGSRQVLDVKNGSKADSANVQAYQSNMTAAQRWKVVHDSKGYLILSNTGSEKALDVNGGIAAEWSECTAIYEEYDSSCRSG